MTRLITRLIRPLFANHSHILKAPQSDRVLLANTTFEFPPPGHCADAFGRHECPEHDVPHVHVGHRERGDIHESGEWGCRGGGFEREPDPANGKARPKVVGRYTAYGTHWEADRGDGN